MSKKESEGTAHGHSSPRCRVPRWVRGGPDSALHSEDITCVSCNLALPEMMSFIYIIGIYIDYPNHLNIYQHINKT